MIQSLDHIFPLARRAHASDRKLVVVQPSDHVEIDHRHGLLQRERRVIDVEIRAEEALFLAGEGDEDKRAFVLFLRSEMARHFDDRRRAGGVVVGPVMDLGRVCGKAARAAVAEMVVVRTDDDGFVFQHRIVAGQDANDVVCGNGHLDKADAQRNTRADVAIADVRIYTVLFLCNKVLDILQRRPVNAEYLGRRRSRRSRASGWRPRRGSGRTPSALGDRARECPRER